jgi:starch-binding outer membrane protein, SusD/RagB family
MRKLLYIMPLLLILGLAACENYVDITPTGKKTVDSTDTYYELVALPNRCYHPASFALLSDNVWSKESTIIGKEYLSWDGINMTFNEEAVRKDLSDNNLYANCYTYILRSNIVISLVDHSTGDKDMKELAKAEAKIMRAWDHFILVNTFAKSYNPETAATDGGVAIVRDYDLEATPTKATVAEVYDFIIKDIEEALPYLQEEPVNVYHPSKAFGYALAARVYLFHREWEKAEKAAKESLKRNNALIDYIALEAAGGPTVVTTYGRGGNPEILNYAHMGGVTEYMSYTYGMISPELIQLFGTNDERMNLFFQDDWKSGILL